MILNGTPIHAVIFDMDGVLIDSEPLWKIAEVAAFATAGIQITATELEQTVGLRIDEVVEFWCQQKGANSKLKEKIISGIMSEMVRLIFERGSPLSGVHEALDFFKAAGVKIGLATSSYKVLLNATLKKLEISHFFNVALSAENLPYGKPHPEVYLQTAKALNISPQNCLVIEDSLNGVISGKSAKMAVVAVPENSHSMNEKLILADYIISDLTELFELF